MSNTRPCYQLKAKGPSANGWRFAIASKAIFTSREEAEAYVGIFKERCCDPEEFDYVQNLNDLEVTILELELHE